MQSCATQTIRSHQACVLLLQAVKEGAETISIALHTSKVESKKYLIKSFFFYTNGKDPQELDVARFAKSFPYMLWNGQRL